MQQNDELFSALLDGEIASEEIDALLDSLEHDPGAADATTRWNCIGTAMRGQGRMPAHGSLLDGVRAAIAEQPISAGVADIAEARARRIQRRRWALPATGVAAAASIAMAAFLMPAMFQTTTSTTGPEAVQPIAGAQVLARSEGASPEAGAGAAQAGAASSQLQQARAFQPAGDREEVLNTYYIEYAGYRTAQGIGGPLGYARYAAHNADMRAPQAR
ncbi:sigma-E factor negative regulatory protein [Algiphilus sp.]|uniref:sigma-E factor negative regulatory protein n=3 Tax=Algiphilus sp. TaxID=1872431 RepID=UPI0025BCC4E0|nr:sigma-E factor negative regulatory protein [Algiphilus sp.]MCK5769760.1 sigma-E factor negative regulatory protein [Algiphilus sp.]